MGYKLLMITVFLFDLVAFGLAVAAELKRSKGFGELDSDGHYWSCKYDSDIATGYGVGAFLFLLVSQLMIVISSKCFCCGSALRPGGLRACAVILFIFCWVTFLIAESCLLAGSVINARHTKMYFNMIPSCETLQRGVFAAGAAFIVFTGIISEFYYATYSKAKGGSSPYAGEPGIGMGAYE